MLFRQMGQTGDSVSILGYGCMRFPKLDKHTDIARTERQIISAIESGVNYFDTAYAYGNSESVLGSILAKGYRDRVLIATKLPLMMANSVAGMERYLATSLQRLQTDRVDYYLMHAINTLEGWQRAKQLGVEGFIERARAAGQVRRIGFSYHGDLDQFKAIVDDYPWDFCQIQYNYLDEHFQAGKEGLEYAAAKGLGVVVMEPLRGGNLVGKMPASVQAVWDKAAVPRSPAEWALRWVWNHPGVTCVLSGMNEESHIEENIRIASEAAPNSLTSAELQLIDEVKTTIAAQLKVGCTGCGYCMPCPAGVNIPFCFSTYNTKNLFHDRNSQMSYVVYTCGMDGGQPAYASKCQDCGKCEKLCPQHLPIRQHLREVAQEMQGWYFKPVVSVVQGFNKVRRMLTRR